jgi:hypothetical protein
MASPRLPHADFSGPAVAHVLAVAESSMDVARRLGELLGLPLIPMDGSSLDASASSSSSSPVPTRLAPDTRGELVVELYAAVLQACRSLNLSPAKTALALSLTQDALAEVADGGWASAAEAAAVWERLVASRAAASTHTRSGTTAPASAASATNAHADAEGAAGVGAAGEEAAGSAAAAAAAEPAFFRASEASGLTDWATRHGWLRHFSMYRRALGGAGGGQRGKRVAVTVHVETPLPPAPLEGAELITSIDMDGEGEGDGADAGAAAAAAGGGEEGKEAAGH